MSQIAQMQQRFRQSGAGRWFYGREEGEQRILLGLVALIVISLLWAFAWKPVADWRTTEQNRQQNAQQVLDWMKANEGALKTAARKGAGNSRRGQIPVITRAAEAEGLALNRLQPDQNGVISVVLQRQPFNEVMSWVSKLEENNGVLVERANIDSDDNPGLVNANLRLN